jgi:molybdopterin converting factor small subunit
MSDLGLGHNSGDVKISVEVRLFNSLAGYAGDGGLCRNLELQAGATVGDVVQELRLPLKDIFLVLRNGRDLSPGLYEGGNVNLQTVLGDGDVVAFSGPVPYSYGYGAPVV